jgi:autotransporter-associated beta strand protein
MLGPWFSRVFGGSLSRCAKRARKRSLAPLGPYFRRLRCEPLECRRMLTAPTITGVNPACPVATNSAQTFTINGSNFQSGCTVTLFDGAGTSYNMSISSQSSTKVVIDPNFGTAQDVWSVEVINPGSGSETSNQLYFPTTPSSLPQPDALGVDYSFASPSPSSLQAAGSSFAVRYVSSSGNSKNIGLSEAQSLLAGGQQIIIVSETTGTEMESGESQGVIDANAAVTEAEAAGAPSNFFCYFACDFDASSSQYSTIDAYLQGAASVMGVSRVGIYGSSYVVSQAIAGGYASKGWQTVAWSNGNEYSGNTLFQYAGVNFLSGCDVDVGIGSNWGQWTPAGLSASATGNQTISVSWSTMGVATGYKLDRATSSSGPWTQVYSGSNASYSDSGLNFGTTYYYEVCGTNGSGSTSFSASVSATTLPGVPTGLAANVTGPQSISVSWNPVSGATKYTLQRATSSSGPWTQVYSNTTPSYSNTGLQSSTTYYYEVAANYATGSSAYSSPVSATTSPTVTIASPTSGQAFTTFPITVSGTATDTGGTGLKDVTVDNTANGSTAAEALSGTSASYSISGITLVPGPNVIDVESFDNGNYHSTVVSVTVNYNPLTWTGGGTPVFFWSIAADWGGTALAAGDDLDFGGSTGLSNTNNHTAGTQYGNLTFDSTAGAFTLKGNSVNLTGDIANYSTNSQTISLALGGTSGLTKTGPGPVILTGANSYSGNTVVAAGKLIVTTSAGLPDGGNLIVGANALTAFGPIVAAAPASAPASDSVPDVAKAVSSSPRIVSGRGGPIQAAPVVPHVRRPVLPAAWAIAVNTDGQQSNQPSSLSAWDAALAEYGREA